MVDHYDSLAINYEELYLRVGYPDPTKVAEAIAEITKTNGWGPQHVKICDFACGTGLVGKNLSERGFTQITGIDVSPKMIEHAKQKKVYDEIVNFKLSSPDPMQDFPHHLRNQYDFVCAAGIVNGNYMNPNLFEEMLMSVKAGCYIVFAARFSYLG